MDASTSAIRHVGGRLKVVAIYGTTTAAKVKDSFIDYLNGYPKDATNIAYIAGKAMLKSSQVFWARFTSSKRQSNCVGGVLLAFASSGGAGSTVAPNPSVCGASAVH